MKLMPVYCCTHLKSSSEESTTKVALSLLEATSEAVGPARYVGGGRDHSTLVFRVGDDFSEFGLYEF